MAFLIFMCIIRGYVIVEVNLQALLTPTSRLPHLELNRNQGISSSSFRTLRFDLYQVIICSNVVGGGGGESSR